jgi:hypothetical protein
MKRLLCWLAVVAALTALVLYARARVVESRAFEEACRVDTLTSYHSFLETFPGTRYRARAEARMTPLAWERAEREDTVEAYEAFLREYSHSAQADSAKKRLSQLITSRFSAAWSEGTVESYRRFAERFPTTLLAKHARISIIALGVRERIRSTRPMPLRPLPAQQTNAILLLFGPVFPRDEIDEVVRRACAYMNLTPEQQLQARLEDDWNIRYVAATGQGLSQPEIVIAFPYVRGRVLEEQAYSIGGIPGVKPSGHLKRYLATGRIVVADGKSPHPVLACHDVTRMAKPLPSKVEAPFYVFPETLQSRYDPRPEVIRKLLEVLEQLPQPARP